jgi:hypothetical protein
MAANAKRMAHMNLRTTMALACVALASLAACGSERAASTTTSAPTITTTSIATYTPTTATSTQTTDAPTTTDTVVPTTEAPTTTIAATVPETATATTPALLIAGVTLAQVGDHNDYVKTMQRALIVGGYDVDADGRWGPATQAAWTAYESTAPAGILPDGVFSAGELPVVNAIAGSYQAPAHTPSALTALTSRSPSSGHSALFAA